MALAEIEGAPKESSGWGPSRYPLVFTLPRMLTHRLHSP
jgi:hypothetical protein